MPITSYKPKVINKWEGGLNTIDKPTPENCYVIGKNVRLSNTFIPDRRDGTGKTNTAAACDLTATASPILNAMKYYPQGQTAQWVALADDDIFFATDGTDFTAQSQSLTADAEGYFAVFPITGGSGNIDRGAFTARWIRRGQHGLQR